MKTVAKAFMGMALLSGISLGQTTFEVTGTPVPSDLLRQNYGSLPKGIGALDLNVCNVSDKRETLVSSMVFQSLTSTNSQIQPIGRQIMLAVILRSQSRSPKSVLNFTLTSLAGVFSIVSASKYKLSGNWAAGVAIASIASQQILNLIKPSTSTNVLEKFESQVLEPALTLDADSCIERTVFTVATQEQMKATRFSFHVQYFGNGHQHNSVHTACGLGNRNADGQFVRVLEGGDAGCGHSGVGCGARHFGQVARS